MNDFYNSLPSAHPIRISRVEHARLQRIFEDDATNGEEMPDLFAAITSLRSELEDYPTKPPVVVAYIALLDADVMMMRSIIDGIKERGNG